MAFPVSSKDRLTTYDLGRFAGATLFDRLGRAVCRAECLPRKELYEAWEMARRIRRHVRGRRIVDLGAGHGLLAYALLLLDDTSPSAVAVDKAIPPSAARLGDALVRQWPRLAARVAYIEGGFDAVAVTREDLVVSSHACGRLTDCVLEIAAGVGAAVAVLPCCHDLAACDTGGLEGWMDGALAIDATRAAWLGARGYAVRTQAIPGEITPKNRLLIGTLVRNPREEPS